MFLVLIWQAGKAPSSVSSIVSLEKWIYLFVLRAPVSYVLQTSTEEQACLDMMLGLTSVPMTVTEILVHLKFQSYWISPGII